MELIKVVQNEKMEQVVSARELHAFLGVNTRFNDWIERKIKKYGFVENIDFVAITQKKVTAQKNEVEFVDYMLKLDMAKEISMVENNEKGKIARRYFIECEKKLHQALNGKDILLLNIIKSDSETDRALALNKYQAEYVKPLEIELQVKEQIIKEYEPKIEYLDTILKTKDVITTTQIAADYGISAQKLNSILHQERIQRKVNGQWLLYADHMNNGYTKSETNEIKLKDGSKKTVINTKWTQK